MCVSQRVCKESRRGEGRGRRGGQRRGGEGKSERLRRREEGRGGIKLIFDTAIGDDICVYRLSDDLTLIWLQKKVLPLLSFLSLFLPFVFSLNIIHLPFYFIDFIFLFILVGQTDETNNRRYGSDSHRHRHCLYVCTYSRCASSDTW